MIELKNIILERKDFTLGPINLTIKGSEAIALMGENGSGKTTLLDLISNLDSPDSGAIKSDEKISYAISESEESFFNATVFDEFRYTLYGCKKDEVREIALSLLEKVSLNPSFLDKSPFSLSGGEKRLLSIALTLAKSPSFVLFDESLAALDYKGYKAVREILKNLRERNIGFILTGHDPSILDLVERLVVLEKGLVIFDGKPIDAMDLGIIEKSFCYKKSIELFNEKILSLEEIIRRVENE